MITPRRICFFGTPEFALGALEALESAGRSPDLVISQPARRSGRGRGRREPPVARWARDRGIELVQPPSVRRSEFLERLREWQPDMAIVVAFGQIFPKTLLEIPAHGCLNLHASLLPAYRGASPIAAAIAAGERETGVTTMVMDPGMDSGPLLLERRVAIGDDETAGELGARLSRIGGDLVVETLAGLEAGVIEPRPQDHSRASFAPRLTKDDGRLDWSRPATALAAQIRAFDPWPGARTKFRGETLAVIKARWVADSELADEPASAFLGPGSFLGCADGALLVRCGGGSRLALLAVQRPGRRVVAAGDLANSERPLPGERFGDLECPLIAGDPPGVGARR